MEQLWQRSGSQEVLTLIDDTGHWGHGCVDILVTSGKAVIPITASDPASLKKYRTVRDEMWLNGADWVKKGGALPHLPEMVPELTEPTYTFIGGKFVVEPKDQVKARLGYSPDLADALFQTFAIPDAPADVMQDLQGRQHARTDFDPYAIGAEHFGRESLGRLSPRVQFDFDPFG
jgi:hypothetical protein